LLYYIVITNGFFGLDLNITENSVSQL